VPQALYLFAACWFLAQVEIQVEGAHGWAENLPTWRFKPAWLLRLTNGKPLTGYWFFLTGFILLMFHLPLFFVPPSKAVEAKILSLYFATCVVWDFQWFIWNPAWGVRRFLGEGAWWFKRRLLGVPVDYYLGILMSWGCLRLLWPEGQSQWVVMFFWLGAATLISMVAAELQRAVRAG
jgi:hypothetical protein